jgi:predicted O-methyltransferase YrrM
MAKDPIPDYLDEFLDSLVPPRPTELVKMEQYAQQKGFPIVGPACGHLCYTLARMIGAKRVFELGSGYGYSTAWFARAVQENGGGQVYHVVWSEELSQKARGHLSALGYDDIVEYRVGEAVQALRETDGPFDLIFNDIDKHGYPDSLAVIREKLRPGGVLIVDNMIWSGRIFDESDRTEDTEAIRRFTRMIATDSAWAGMVLPLRDGLMLAYKQP